MTDSAVHSRDRTAEPPDELAQRVAGIAAVVGPEFAVVDVATAGGWSVTEAADLLDGAHAAGLLLFIGTTGHFASAASRQQAISRLGSAPALAAHDRLAGLLEAGWPNGRSDTITLTRLAHHAVSSAGLSVANAERARRWAPCAADRLMRSGHPQAALELLDEVATFAGPVPDLRIRLVQAQATLRAGRLELARTRFTVAAGLARDAGDDEAFALAAIGLGGLWVNEHRGSSEATRARTIWEDALAILGPEHDVLRLRLTARLAAERAYLAVDSSEPRSVLLTTADRLRELGENAALVEVLALLQHVCLGPADTELRQDIIAEMLPTAYRCDDEHLVLMALCWKAVNAYLAGEPDADRQLAAFRERLALVDNDALRYVSGLFDVQNAIRDGRWARAEQLAADCLAAGLDVGDRDAQAYYAAQLLSIRWRQGREIELQRTVDDLVVSPTVPDGSVGFVAAQAAIAARAGDLDTARKAMHRLPATGIAGIPPGSGWLVTVCALVETAHALPDRELAQSCYDALLPFAALPVVASLAASYGPVERWLSLAAATLGRLDQAAEHLEAAIEACLITGETAMHATLLPILSELRRKADAARPTLSVVRNGRRWVVSMGSRQAVVRDLVGLGYLAQLAHRPGTGVPALELVAVPRSVPTDFLSDQPVLDRQALRALRRRLVDLESEITEAGNWHDAGRRDALDGQREAILAELGRVLNVGGGSRSFIGPAERARVSVRKALLRALDEVEAVDGWLGGRLRTALRTGHVCSLQL